MRMNRGTSSSARTRDEVGADVTAKAESTAEFGCVLETASVGSFSNTGSVTATGVTETVSVSGFFAADVDGKIEGSLTLPTAAANVRCAAGMRLVVTAVTFRNVQLTSPTAGTKLVSGTFTRTWTY